MPLDIRQIKPFVHTHEKMMWDSLVEGLKRVYKEDNRPHILLGNFSCERQFDALYLSPRGICIIELNTKNHHSAAICIFYLLFEELLVSPFLLFLSVNLWIKLAPVEYVFHDQKMSHWFLCSGLFL